MHVAPDVTKDINEYRDSWDEGELAGRDFLFYMEQPWSTVGKTQVGFSFLIYGVRGKRNDSLNVIVKI